MGMKLNRIIYWKYIYIFGYFNMLYLCNTLRLFKNSNFFITVLKFTLSVEIDYSKKKMFFEAAYL